jgi:hypothetical protein
VTRAEPLPGVEAETRATARARSERLLAAVPLASLYVWLSLVYLVEAWKRVTPWLFTDELELTQLSRSIAETGHAARRGTPITAHTLYPYVTAPLWLIHDVGTAYAGIKYLDVFLMASVVFPTYFLARLLVGRNMALFAAAGAGAIPSLAYSSYIVEETIAYPYAALCFFLLAKALLQYLRHERWRGWGAAALAACAIAPAVRGELVVVLAVAALAVVFVAWSSARARAWRETWSIGDWVGLVLLVLGAIFVVSGIASQRSVAWLAITRFYKDRILDQGQWAVGSLAVGLGVAPLVAGLAVLVPARGERRDDALRVFRSVSVAALLAFGLYTSMKAAYLSTVFATRVEERNLIYVAPLLFVGTAVLLERRRVNLAALAAAGAYALYLMAYAAYHAVGSPYEMGVQLYSDALGFSILQQANRTLHLDTTQARVLMLGVLAVTLLALLAPRLLGRRPRLAAGVTAAFAVAIVGWNLTGEIAAAVGSVSFSRSAAETLGTPFRWVDDATHGQPTVYLGEGEADQNPEWMLEFWNRSIARVSSLDGSIDGPGPAGGPNLRPDGTTLFDADAARPDGVQYAYAVEDWPCVDYAGTLVQTHLRRAGGELQPWRLVALTRPNRLRSVCSGIYPDGWTGANDSAYFRFSGGHGWLRIGISRANWSGDTGPSPVHVLLGRLVVNENSQPILGPLHRQLDLSIDSGQTKTVCLRTTSERFAVHVVVDKKFVPHDYDPQLGDSRQLGAQVSYDFTGGRPSGC